MPPIRTPEFGLPSPGVSSVDLDDGGLIIYDTTREAAWIQTDAPVVLRRSR